MWGTNLEPVVKREQGSEDRNLRSSYPNRALSGQLRQFFARFAVSVVTGSPFERFDFQPAAIPGGHLDGVAGRDGSGPVGTGFPGRAPHVDGAGWANFVDGDTGLADDPFPADVGVANRVRIMAGMPPAMPTMVTRTPETRLSHDRGVPSKRNSDPTTRAAVPMAVQARGTPVWTSTA